MKKIYIFLIGLMMLFSLISCETYTYATTQDDIYIENEVDIVQSNVSFDIVLRYGRPYYRDGILLYYIYNNLYYYPYYYGNYWYVRAYRRPFPHVNYRPYFRPHKYDYRFSPDRYRMHGIYGTRPHNNYRGHYKHDPNINRHRHQQPQYRRHNNHQNRPMIDRNQNNHRQHRNMGGRR